MSETATSDDPLAAFYSSETDEWATPKWLLRKLSAAVDGFDLDPASGAESSPVADEAYTEADNGLAQPWHGTVWCNPPYSDVERWAAKARSEAERERVDTVLFLVAARTASGWWHDHVNEGATAIVFIKGRLAFGTDPDGTAPFPSALAAFGRVPEGLMAELTDLGMVATQWDHGPTQQSRIEDHH